jgi:DNA polymerase III sliding clamp (beta) subunit (PCNA family)
MKLERKLLLDALNMVKPALATKDLIEELSHCWFDGEYVMAYNDAELGIQVELETPFKGGIRGSLLLGLLHNSRAKEITLEEADEGTMLLKAARTRATLSVLDYERCPWKFPEIDPKKAYEITNQDFIPALERVLIATGKDTSVPETMGVTIKAGDGKIVLYATDSSNVIATESIDTKSTRWDGTRIVPKAFCEEFLSLCSDKGRIEFRKDSVVGQTPDNVQIYARLVHTRKPLDFEDMIGKHSKFTKEAKFETPERLSLALDRMSVLFEGLINEKMKVTLGQGKMRLEAKVEGRGELKDSVVIPDNVPELEFWTEPAFIRRALDLTTHMVCSEDSVRMSGGRFVYLVSNSVVNK